MNEYLVSVESEGHEFDQMIRVRARNKTAAILVAGAVLKAHVRADWVIGVETKLMRRG